MAVDPSVFVHPQALCESEQVGAGTRIWAFAHVMNGAIVGEDCNVCGHAFIEGGAVVGNRVTVKNGVAIWDKVTIEDDVFLGPNMVFTNDPNPRVQFKKEPSAFVPTHVGHGVSIGANATILCATTLHDYAFVGAGSVVTKDVPAYALVLGNPANQVGWMCRCGQRIDNNTLQCSCGAAYKLAGDGLEKL